MIGSKPTVLANLQRILRNIGLIDFVDFRHINEWTDRITAWPTGGYIGSLTPLEAHCIGGTDLPEPTWFRDPEAALHGGGRSYRENAIPSMQIVFHEDIPSGLIPGYPVAMASCYLELDIDYAPPQRDVQSALIHLFGEVLYNAIWHHLTDESKIAVMLDKRFPNA